MHTLSLQRIAGLQSFLAQFPGFIITEYLSNVCMVHMQTREEEKENREEKKNQAGFCLYEWEEMKNSTMCWMPGIQATPHLSYMKPCKVGISIPMVQAQKRRLGEVVTCSRPHNVEVAAPGFKTRSVWSWGLDPSRAPHQGQRQNPHSHHLPAGVLVRLPSQECGGDLHSTLFSHIVLAWTDSLLLIPQILL